MAYFEGNAIKIIGATLFSLANTTLTQNALMNIQISKNHF